MVWRTGERLKAALEKKITSYGLRDSILPAGKPPWLLLSFKDCGGSTSWQVKTLFMQEMLSRGILIQGSHNFNFAHDKAAIDALLDAYDAVLPILSEAVHSGAMERLLEGPVMQPLFQVR